MSAPRAKNPMRPPAPLVAEPTDFVAYESALWRIYRTQGHHRQQWNDLRAFGPLASMRWDPHPPPPAKQPDWAVGYASAGVVTAFAEVFQDRRTIRPTSSLALAGWMPTRPLTLLDLTGRWPLHNGASSSLAGGRKDRCRNWAHEIRRTWPEADGLYVPSSVTGEPAVVLFAPARTTFPSGPAFARPLDSPALAGTLRHAATALRWPIR